MYFKWSQQTVTDFSDENIEKQYDNGFVFGRIDRGVMDQTRSLRINLDEFELSSENRRVIKKTDGLQISQTALPYHEYDWHIGKLGKDFYDSKFGEKTFSANKIKELMTDRKKSNFNKLLKYSFLSSEAATPEILGYCICFSTEKILHYCYPFYNLDSNIPNVGLGMMLRAILWAKETYHEYIYLGSAQRPTDTYKLQFSGIEWFDGEKWQTDLKKLKNEIQTV